MDDLFVEDANWEREVAEFDDWNPENEEEEEEEDDFEDSAFWQLYLTRKPTATLRMWNEDIGIPVCIVKTAWNSMCVHCTENKVIPLDFLWLLNWMRRHSTVNNHAGDWGTSASTFHRRVVHCLYTALPALGGWLNTEECFIERWSYPVCLDSRKTFDMATVCVDVTECEIHAFQHRAAQRAYYNGRKGFPTHKFQVAVAISSSVIVSASTLFPGTVHDLNVLEQTHILDWMLPGERIVVDRGYTDETIAHKVIIGFNDGDQTTAARKQWNNLVASVRIEAARIKAYIKKFRVFRMTYLKSPEHRMAMFHLTCHLINLRLRSFPSRVYPHPNIMNAEMERPA